MKFNIVFLLIVFVSQQGLAQNQRQSTDLFGLFRPWSQAITSNTQSAGQQLVQLLGSSLERWNQLGDQITTSIGMRMEQMENQIHDLAKEIRQTIYNHNLRQNATLTKIGYR